MGRESKVSGVFFNIKDGEIRAAESKAWLRINYVLAILSIEQQDRTYTVIKAKMVSEQRHHSSPPGGK